MPRSRSFHEKGIGRVDAFDAAKWPELRKGQIIVRVDARCFRPAEVQTLLGDATKAKTRLGWEATIIFPEMVIELMREDLSAARRDELARAHGHRTYNNQDE